MPTHVSVTVVREDLGHNLLDFAGFWLATASPELSIGGNGKTVNARQMFLAAQVAGLRLCGCGC